MMYYALKSALLLTLLYGGFSALLSRETFHRFNRIMLLGIVLLSLGLPAVQIRVENKLNTLNALQPHPLPLPLWEGSEYTQEVYSADNATTPLPQGEGSGVGLQGVVGLKSLLALLYTIGVCLTLACFLRRSVLLIRNLQGGLRLHDRQGNTIIVKGGEFPPFSFMHWIVISVGDYEKYRRSILTHEQAHARLGHSWDVLLLEGLQVVQWFNPFAWLLGRELKAVHEYEADEAVICQGIDAKQYQQLLVIKAVGNRLQLLANTLNRGSLKKRINMMQQQKSNRWRMLRAAFVIPVATLAVIAFAKPEIKTNEVQQTVLNESKPLVEYKTHDKVGKSYRDYYRVNFGEGVWVENNGASHIEEQCFTYSFDNRRNGKTNNMVTMMLNGVPFDQNSLPKLSCNDLKKMEIKKATVNLITTPVTIPAGIEGNVPRVQTLLLPGKGELYIKNGKATPGDWMHCSITDWEPTSYNYSVRNEFERSKTKPGFKCWIYASKETAEKDISRAEALMRELGIKNYEVVRNLPKKHFTDSELRLWAQKEKAKGTPFSHLFDAMAPNHMDCADVHRQWHIVKAVYGRK